MVRPATRRAGDGGACLVAGNRTNLEMVGAGEVEGDSPTLAEHFRRGNLGPKSPVVMVWHYLGLRGECN